MLVGPLNLPEGRCFWVEVHQKLSNVNGEALNEVFVDGVKAGASTTANSRGRVVNNIRYGLPALAPGCSGASTIYFDDPSISSVQRGTH